MDHARLLQIAHRMHPLLLHELQHAIDIRRLLDDERYARDVLLVCDAMPGHDLASLARHFRAAAAPAADAATAPMPARRAAASVAAADTRPDAPRAWAPSGAGAAALPTPQPPAQRRWFAGGWRAAR